MVLKGKLTSGQHVTTREKAKSVVFFGFMIILALAVGWFLGGGSFATPFFPKDMSSLAIFANVIMLPFGLALVLAQGFNNLSNLKDFGDFNSIDSDTQSRICKKYTTMLVVIWFVLSLGTASVVGSYNISHTHAFKHSITEQYKQEHHVDEVSVERKDAVTDKNGDVLSVYKFTTPDNKYDLIAYKGHGYTTTSHKKISEAEFQALQSGKRGQQER